MNFAIPAPASAAVIGRRVRVMIVDDAAVVRGLFTRWAEAEPDMDVVASLRTGREAVAQVERADPDVVVLDVDMPEMDGITALPLLLAKKRDLVIIMASTLTRRNAEISLRALSLGAIDYIPKPTSNHEVAGSPIFRRELMEKIRQLGLRCKRLRQAPAAVNITNINARTPLAPAPAVMTPARPVPLSHNTRHEPIVLRQMPMTPPRVLLIGSSTGGPQALNAIVAEIGGLIDRVPVLITQHMPPTFTAILAEHLARLSKRPAREARDGEAIVAGTIYLAPGGKHMQVVRRDNAAAIALDDGPLVNFCKPAVDPLFASAAAFWGNKTLALVLTGMGSDGLHGAQAIVAAGGHILAQDEATSVVWGMPGQVALAGFCSAVLPINEIPSKLTRLYTGERS